MGSWVRVRVPAAGGGGHGAAGRVVRPWRRALSARPAAIPGLLRAGLRSAQVRPGPARPGSAALVRPRFGTSPLGRRHVETRRQYCVCGRRPRAVCATGAPLAGGRGWGHPVRDVGGKLGSLCICGVRAGDPQAWAWGAGRGGSSPGCGVQAGGRRQGGLSWMWGAGQWLKVTPKEAGLP